MAWRRGHLVPSQAPGRRAHAVAGRNCRPNDAMVGFLSVKGLGRLEYESGHECTVCAMVAMRCLRA